ncbi:uncharacterized protein LOC108108720 [Drosophila eugracilis]|uniref:uncharacterized protein LOC108108720 n=1 Tax=Drosophila eugracilis TaxID=29029 RepID=UPI0007E616DC|nr:uncharacterized protein LOC108108720 [Drosophila eugracilis]
MKISLFSLSIITLVLLMCSFAVEAGKPLKCKPPLKLNPRTKKCFKASVKKVAVAKATTKAAAAESATTAA